MEKLLGLVAWNRSLFLFTAHLMTTWRFWQAVRRSRDCGLSESIAAGAHLVLVRALRNSEGMTIPTYDDDQTQYPVHLPPKAA